MKKILTVVLLLLAVTNNAAAQNENALTAAEREIAESNRQISQLAKEKRFSEAVSTAQKVVGLTKRNLGENHLETGKALHTLGYLYFVSNDKKKSEISLENALQIYELNKDKNIENLSVGVLETLASIKFEKDEYKEAKNLLENATSIRKKINGENSPQVASNNWSLANINYTMSNYSESAVLYQKVFDFRKSRNEIAGTELFDAYTRCSCSMYKAGKRLEAEAFEKEFFDQVYEKVKFKKVDVLEGYAIKIPEPKYPVVASKFKKSGEIEVFVVVNEKGNVAFSCAKTDEYYFGFTNAAEKAAYEAKFLPLFVKNEPVKAVTTITYIFKS